MLVPSPDAPPTRGKEHLVAIDTNIGPMMSLYFDISGCGLGFDWSESSHIKPFHDLIGDLDFEIMKVLGPRNVSTVALIVTRPPFPRDHVSGWGLGKIPGSRGGI